MFSLARKCVTPNCLKTPGKWHRRCHWEGVIGNGIEWSFEAVENIRTVQSLNKQLFFHRKYASLLSAPHRFPPPFFWHFPLLIQCQYAPSAHLRVRVRFLPVVDLLHVRSCLLGRLPFRFEWHYAPGISFSVKLHKVFAATNCPFLACFLPSLSVANPSVKLGIILGFVVTFHLLILPLSALSSPML